MAGFFRDEEGVKAVGEYLRTICEAGDHVQRLLK
jgi:hypothetical protein